MITRVTRLTYVEAAFLALLLLCAPAAAQAPEETKTVTVVGSAPLQGGKIPAAREAAIADGLKQAVAAAAIEILSPVGFADNFKALNELLLGRYEEYIQGFKLLSEAPSGKHHLVLLQATVATRKIRAAMADSGVLGKKPAADSTPVALTVVGSGNLANFVKLRRALAAISGVATVQVKEMKPNEAILLVDFTGGGRELAAALALQAFDTFEVSVSEVQESALKVELRPKLVRRPQDKPYPAQASSDHVGFPTKWLS
ncbi:MAG: hypothetical protein R6V84_09915 [Desulfobacterales bacterium]